ncbi:MAG: divergent polysaccharide deacetylase family protein [Spirochaetia bacterium]|jgi:polysaccharide deacetylase 2 family uncharacterized protein YibQ|nr:divergent polysaccharide deacetylase family protein [Spirochaetia bacterium]
MQEKRLKIVILLLIVIITLLFFSIILINVKTTSDGEIEEIELLPYKEPVLDEGDSIETIPDKVPEETAGALYFVIDDVGNNLFQLKPFLKLPMSITFAVLPGLKYTREAIDLIRDAGKNYIIHQPIEAVGGQNPGPGALLTDMNQDQVRKIINENIKDFYDVSGMNNHMGSAGTADYELMGFLFTVLKENGLYFLDSRTTSKSVGRQLAADVGIPFAERSIFLDNSEEKQDILEAIESGLNISKKKGHAIMIGHIWTEELASILLELYPTLLENNYVLNNLTELFTGTEFNEDTWY